jgi:hypothetical protein
MSHQVPTEHKIKTGSPLHKYAPDTLWQISEGLAQSIGDFTVSTLLGVDIDSV